MGTPTRSVFALVAELADAPDSSPGVREDVGVRVSPEAPMADTVSKTPALDPEEIPAHLPPLFRTVLHALLHLPEDQPYRAGNFRVMPTGEPSHDARDGVWTYQITYHSTDFNDPVTRYVQGTWR